MLEISTKSEETIITAPVLIPGVPDCDYHNGEKPLTTKQVQDIASSFKEYGIIDRNHTYFHNFKEVGTPLDSWITTTPMTLKGIDGEVREYPTGTWMLKSLITDELAIKELKNNILTGYSVSTVPRKEAEKFKKAISQMASKSEPPKRVNINDIDDPVAYTVSVVRKPCQFSAKFCDLKLVKKEENMEDTELSEEITQEKLEQGIIGAFKSLFKNEEEDKEASIDTSEFALKSDLESLKAEILEGVTAALKAKEEEEAKTEEEEEEEAKEESDEEEKSSKKESEESEETETDGLTPEEEKEFQRLLAKRKKPQTSNKSDNKSKSLNIHEGMEISNKSDNKSIMAVLGRTADGRYKGEPQKK